jgi:hypothetical protein
MITIISLVLFFIIFGKLLIFALKVGWGILKIAAYLIFFPALILAMIFGGLLYIAIPLLIVAGFVAIAPSAC